MKTYKKIILEKLTGHKFEITEIADQAELPWWIEEQWTTTRSRDQLQLLVIFLTERHWESGPKGVSEIVIAEQPMTGYTDTGHKIAGLYLDQGRFDEKMHAFGAELDAYLNKALS